MRKLAYSLVVVVIVTTHFFLSAYCQEDMKFVDNSVFSKAKRSPSVFDHEAHNENAGLEECSECHHLYEDGKLVEGESSEDQRCSDCHSEKSEGGKPSLMKAFHMNCKGCHSAEKKGPVMCGECHKK